MNSHFYRFAALCLYTHKSKHLAPFILFFILVFLVCSILFISSSLKSTSLTIVENQPQILVENYRGGAKSTVDDFYFEALKDIKGIRGIIPRVSGKYYFEQSKTYFTIIGVDFFAPNFNTTINTLTKQYAKQSDKNSVFIGSGTQNVLDKFAYKDSLTLFSHGGESLHVKIIPLDDKDFSLLSHSVILCNMDLAKELLGMEKFEYSDFFVDVPNETEVPNIVAQIRTLFPNSKITTKEESIALAFNLYDYKSGLFLALFLTAITSFMILLYQKTIFSFAHEKREIGILRALGWKISDIIQFKLIQNLFIALSAFILALLCSYIFVFKTNAPLLKNIFLGSDALSIQTHFIPSFAMMDIVILLLLSVVPFMASVLLPSWKLSTIDPTEVMK